MTTRKELCTAKTQAINDIVSDAHPVESSQMNSHCPPVAGSPDTESVVQAETSGEPLPTVAEPSCVPESLIEPESEPKPEPASEPAPALEPAAKTVPVAVQSSAEPAPKKRYVQPKGGHFVLAEAVVGLQHRNHKPYALPCQDAVQVTLKPRPVLIVCDGAGSAPVSEIGASTLTLQLSRLCQSLDPVLVPLLDLDTPAGNGDALVWVRVIVRHTMGLLQDLAQVHRRDVRDFRATLNLALVGKARILWIKVGDGEIVQEKISYLDSQPMQLSSELVCLGEVVKGEYANQTQFVDDRLSLNDVQWGLLDSVATTGLALMSDGATEKLVANSRDRVSGQVSDWLGKLRDGALKPGDLIKRFYSDEFSHRSTGDDRSIALWARAFDPE